MWYEEQHLNEIYMRCEQTRAERKGGIEEMMVWKSSVRAALSDGVGEICLLFDHDRRAHDAERRNFIAQKFILANKI